MRRRYCTLFDRRYLAKGLAMIDSLRAQSKPEEPLIHVLALDDETEAALRAKGLPGVGVWNLPTFEKHEGLRAVRASRSWQEYCWTLASVWAFHLMRTEEEVTYLDADLLFFADPEIAFTEIGDRVIAIVPHRFPKETAGRFEPNGRFNVSWVTFRGDVGRACAERWAAQCREWCFYRNEDGRFGDQKYLDEWPVLYPEALHVFKDPGIGLAPWNVAQYDITEGPKVNGLPVVFYHFHEYEHGRVLTNHPLPDGARPFIYKPYAEAIEAFTEATVSE